MIPLMWYLYGANFSIIICDPFRGHHNTLADVALCENEFGVESCKETGASRI